MKEQLQFFSVMAQRMKISAPFTGCMKWVLNCHGFNSMSTKLKNSDWELVDEAGPVPQEAMSKQVLKDPNSLMTSRSKSGR